MSKLEKFAAACAAAVVSVSASAASVDKYYEYVETDGLKTAGVYVLLDYTPTSDSVVEAKVQFLDVDNTGALFCARGSTTSESTFTLFSIGKSGFRWDYNRVDSLYWKIDNQKHDLRATNYGLFVDEDETAKLAVTPANPSYTAANRMTLFGSYTATAGTTPVPADNFAKLRLYSFKAYDLEGDRLMLKLDLRPCVDTDGKAALYDAVNDKLYYATAVGTGKSMSAGGTEVFYEQPDQLVIEGDPANIGEVAPAYGVTNGLAVGASFACSAPSWTNAEGDVAYDCIGYAVYAGKDIVAYGDDSSFTYEHPDDEKGARLVWQWEASYRVTVGSDAGGSATTVDEWKKSGETVEISASPAEGYVFAGWIGNLPDEQDRMSPSVTLTVGEEPIALTAAFEGAEDPACVYLKADAAGTGTGRSWANACTNVAEAITAALAAGKPLYVAQGVYIVKQVRELTSALTIYGGFPGVSVAETLDDRDPVRYASIFTGDQALDDVWQHVVTNGYTVTQTELANKPIISNGKLNLPPDFTDDYDAYAPSKKNTNTTGAFMVLAGGGLTVDGVTFSGFYNTNSSGVDKSGASADAVIMFVAGSLSVRHCRFIGNACGQGMIYSRANYTVSDSDFMYLWGTSRGVALSQHAGTVTGKNCRFISLARTANSSSQVINNWSGYGFNFTSCTFARCILAMGSGYNANYGGPANIYGAEGGASSSFTDCAISNCFTATSSNYGPVMMSGRGTFQLTRCLVANNLGVCKPGLNKAYCLFGQATDTGKSRRVYDGTTFVGNEMRAREVGLSSGSYALGLLGNNVSGSDTLFNNCTFVSNRVSAVEKDGVTAVLSRNVVTYASAAGSTAQTGLANCTFVGPCQPGVYEVAQFGSGHTKDINLVNCVFSADGEAQVDPVYADLPSLVHLINCSVQNKIVVSAGDEKTYEGLTYDKFAYEPFVADPATGRFVYRPAAKVPDIRVTCDVATNHTSVPMSWMFRRPESTTWECLASNTGKNGSSWNDKLVGDAAGAVRPAGSFTRGAVQGLTTAAEEGHSLVLRRDPFAAGHFDGSVSQAVAADGEMTSVTAVSDDPSLYTFDGWYDADGNKVSSEATISGVSLTDELMVLTAKFRVPEVELTFDLGEAGVFAGSGSSKAVVTITPGSVFPQVPEYTVNEGWYVVGFTLPTIVPTQDATYVADYVTSDLRIAYVTPGGAGTKDGTSWANAYGDPATAMADVGRCRGEVWIKEGVYVISNTIPMYANVALRGGFAGDETEASAADPANRLTVLTGDVNDNDYWQPNGSGGAVTTHKIWQDGVFNAPNPGQQNNYWRPSGNVSDDTPTAFVCSGMATNAVFDGVVLTCFKDGMVIATSGNSRGLRFNRCRFLAGNSSVDVVDGQRGAFRLVDSMTFEDCVFQGLWFALSTSAPSGSTLTFRRCEFADNSTGSYGAAIRVNSNTKVVVEGSRFARNFNNARSFQAGSSVSLYGAATFEATDCTFEDEINTGDSHGAIVMQGGASVSITRCRFLRNRRVDMPSNGYETMYSACFSVGNSGANLLVRDSLFEGNQAKVTAQSSEWFGSVLAMSSGSATFVNSTFLGNVATSSYATNQVGTAAIYGGNAAFVVCTFKDGVISGVTEKRAELYSSSDATIGIVNSALASTNEGYRAICASSANWTPNIANSYVQGFDASAFEPLMANGYLYDVVTEGDTDLMSGQETNALGVVALGVRGAGPVRGRPTWLSGRTVYFYDDVANAAKPWRKAIDRGSYAASVSGLERIPDAFGQKRASKSSSIGPVERRLGLTLIVR